MIVHWEIARTKPVGPTRGFSIPAFIHNWQYHYSPLKVYRDGLIDCWSSVDLAIFQRKLKQGWVVPDVPVGGHISIHNLGGAIAQRCEWRSTPADLIKQVEAAVDLLNPGRVGLIDLQGEEDVALGGKLRRSKFSITNGKPYRLDAEGRDVAGDSVPVFLQTGSDFYLSSWFIFADGSSRVGTSGELSSLEEVASRLTCGDLRTSVPNGSRITIEGLGWFETKASAWGVEPGERVREANDVLAMLKGEPGSLQTCRRSFREFQEDPSPKNLHRLRTAYESVPGHLRHYCGDMDSKDKPIRKVLYGEESSAINP